MIRMIHVIYNLKLLSYIFFNFQERIGPIASVNSAFGTVSAAPLQRGPPVPSLTELQNSYLPTHFQSQHLSVSTTPVSTPESRNSDGSRINDTGGSPHTVSPDGISHNFGLGNRERI